MESIFQKYIKVCPKSGRIKKINYPAGIYKIFIPVIGFAALLWILIRVIPKPSRIDYPCIKAATPLASGFLFYVTTLILSALVFLKTKKRIFLSPYFLLAGLAVFGFSDSSYVDVNAIETEAALANPYQAANNPIGEGKGIFPGRVVWAYDPNSTNENCKTSSFGDAYYLPKNTSMDVVNTMVNNSLLRLTGKTTVHDAWDALFVSFNTNKGKGTAGYKAGEKIFIKTNGIGSTVVDSSNHNITDLTSYVESRTSPQPVLALLRGLINECGIPQENISVGDPQRDIQNEYWDIWHTEFPKVKYICHKGGQGRTIAVKGKQPSIFYSDKGTVLRTGSWADMSTGSPVYQDTLYTVIEQADYMIYVGALKVHERAGMTVLAKVNFGSHVRSNAMQVHMGLVNPDGVAPSGNKNSRFGYSKYRVLVDMLGSKKLIGNSMLNVVDGLWGSTGANTKPVKFYMPPFNNDWPSSILMSQDPVALESVCYDILKTEFTSDKHAETYPQMAGVDDHLHQAADTTLWPAGIKYAPDGDGVHLKSLGTHEHWNNSTDMQYSRNLGLNTGIEHVKLMSYTDIEKEAELPAKYNLSQNYPNPFNPVTIIEYSIPKNQNVTVKVYDVSGREVATLENTYRSAGSYRIQFDPKQLSTGVYFYKLTAGNFVDTKKMILLK